MAMSKTLRDQPTMQVRRYTRSVRTGTRWLRINEMLRNDIIANLEEISQWKEEGRPKRQGSHLVRAGWEALGQKVTGSMGIVGNALIPSPMTKAQS